jgi:3D (Asp-Asp-Asp) domain-containing protein
MQEILVKNEYIPVCENLTTLPAYDIIQKRFERRECMNLKNFTKVEFRNKMLPLIVVPLFIILLLATGWFAQRKVVIQADGRQIAVRTIYSKPEAVLSQAGIKLGPKDEYRMSTKTIGNGTVIDVYRAVPVTVVRQGKTEAIVTAKPTVGELVESMGYRENQVQTEPGFQTLIQKGMQIKLIVLKTKLEEREAAAPFSVVRKPDPELEKGVERIAEAGQNGIKVITYREHFADNEKVSEEPVSEKIKVAPKPEVILVGTRDTVATSRGAMRFSRTRIMEATAYLPTDGSGNGITATGIPARRGIVAVDPSVIPLGTRLYVQGYGLALAADVGGAIVGNRIDLCMDHRNNAINFGRQTVKVYILDD